MLSEISNSSIILFSKYIDKDNKTFQNTISKFEKRNDNTLKTEISNRDIETHSKKENIKKLNDNPAILNPFEIESIQEKYKVTIPFKLLCEIQVIYKKENLEPISNNENIPGNYSKYVSSAFDYIKKFKKINFNEIFDEKNSQNINYVNYDYHPTKKLLIIDLDETLFHTKFRTDENMQLLNTLKNKTKCKSKTFSLKLDNKTIFFDVFFRPFLLEFLTEIQNSNLYEMAIFTAAKKKYADVILDYIESRKKFFKFRLYRDCCIPIGNGISIKDLRIIKNFDEKKTILMDNSFYSFMNQPQNGLLINSFLLNDKDYQLLNAKIYLIEKIGNKEDVREVNNKFFKFDELFNGKEIFENETEAKDSESNKNDSSSISDDKMDIEEDF